MTKKQKPGANNIEPGMVVEATKGDLGEEDISKPKVSSVVQDQHGDVEKLVVQKGVVFKKTLEIPADSIQSVDAANQDESITGKVTIEVSKEEAASLTAIGAEEFSPEKQRGLLDKVEQKVPTAEGVRRLEARGTDTPAKRKRPNFLFHILGPGFLGGMAGNDSSAVASYSVDGATNGYGHLWLLLLSTPLYQAVQFACAKLGRITQKGLAEILREHYSRWVAIPASLILVVANLALIAADLVAIGSGLELLTGVSWVWFVVPVAVILWYFTVYRSFETIKKIFIVMSLAFVSYFIAAFFTHANVRAVLVGTFVPHVDFGFASICPIPDLINKSLRENYRAKNGMTEKKMNDSKIASIFTNKIKPVRHDVPSKDTLVCLYLKNCSDHRLIVSCDTP